MDPTEILNVRFHIGGEFVRVGQEMDYVGGDEEMSEIERDKLSLQEVKGFLRDHVEVKDSMKIYFLLPGKGLGDGLMFLHNDSGCVKMADYTEVGGVADIYVEYHGEQDSEYSSSGSDFEDEIVEVSDDEPAMVITAESDDDCVAVQQVMVPNDTGVHLLKPEVLHLQCQQEEEGTGGENQLNPFRLTPISLVVAMSTRC